MSTFPNAIVLTGGIATGKSTVASLLTLHGFAIIDADKIAHKILEENSNKIAELFGAEYVENGEVLRKKLGALIFGDKTAKERLESFIHPLIHQEILNQAKLHENNNKPYIVDIPLFFERANYPFEKSVVVYTPKEIQIERCMKRDNLDEKNVIQRINAQMDIEEKKAKADYIIDNSTTLKNLQNECENFISQIK